MTFSYRHFGAFRLLLACLVVFQHFTANAAPEAFREAMALYWGGNIAVLIFFCLSGFVIAEAVHCIYFEKPISFIANRLLRIVPHFLIAVLISITFHYIFFAAGDLRVARDMPITPSFGESFNVADIVLNCIGFLPIPLNKLTHYDFLDVAWAVRIEMAFYLAVFLILTVVHLLSWPRTYGLVLMVGTAVLLYAVAAVGLLPPKVGLVVYFAFGYSLYFAANGSRIAKYLSIAWIPAMVVHFIQQPNYTGTKPMGRDLTADLLMFGLLLTTMVFLACNRIRGFRRVDRFLGDLTYPLYMYHINVLVVLMSLTTGYHYLVYAAGMSLSIVIAYAFSIAVDPFVNRLRDWIRGRKVDMPPASIPVQPERTGRLSWTR